MSDAYAFVFVTSLGVLGLATAVPQAFLNRQGPAVRALLILAVLALTAIPVNGVAIGRLPAACGYQPSVPLLVLIMAAADRKLTGRTWLSPVDRTVTWTCLAIAGTVLFPSVLGLGRNDLYALGWNWSPVFGVATVATLALLAGGSRAGVLLLAAAVAFDLTLIGSANLWDYFVDPIGWILGLVFLAAKIERLVVPRRGGVSPA